MDSTPSVLREFSLDMDSGELNLTFSDGVSVASFRGDAITLQSSATAHSGGYVTLFRNSTSPAPGAKDGFVLHIVISNPDLNRVKQVTSLDNAINSY